MDVSSFCDITETQLVVSLFFLSSLTKRRTGIARSRVQTPLKPWLFQACIRNCVNCVHNCDDHSLLDLKTFSVVEIRFCYGYWRKSEKIRTLVRCRICALTVRSDLVFYHCSVGKARGQSHTISYWWLRVFCNSAKNKRVAETLAPRETHNASGAPKFNFRQLPRVACPPSPRVRVYFSRLFVSRRT